MHIRPLPAGVFRWLPAALIVGALSLAAAGCSTSTRSPDERPQTPTERGEYLVNLLGCGRCHTEGYLLGVAATGPYLAGSRIGIAYSGADDEPNPGLVFAPNLTPDAATGLGTWSERDIVRALTTGVGTDGHQRLPVMPWPNYQALRPGDLSAIASYLKSLPPLARKIPSATLPGDPVDHPYVRFGIYVFQPAQPAAAR